MKSGLVYAELSGTPLALLFVHYLTYARSLDGICELDTIKNCIQQILNPMCVATVVWTNHSYLSANKLSVRGIHTQLGSQLATTCKNKLIAIFYYLKAGYCKYYTQ